MVHVSWRIGVLDLGHVWCVLRVTKLSSGPVAAANVA